MANKKTGLDIQEITHQLKKVDPKITQGKLAEKYGKQGNTFSTMHKRDYPVLRTLLQFQELTGQSATAIIKTYRNKTFLDVKKLLSVHKVINPKETQRTLSKVYNRNETDFCTMGKRNYYILRIALDFHKQTGLPIETIIKEFE